MPWQEGVVPAFPFACATVVPLAPVPWQEGAVPARCRMFRISVFLPWQEGVPLATFHPVQVTFRTAVAISHSVQATIRTVVAHVLRTRSIVVLRGSVPVLGLCPGCVVVSVVPLVLVAPHLFRPNLAAYVLPLFAAKSVHD